MGINDTSVSKYRIEKFKGSFKEIEGGGTILFTQIIQTIKNQSNLAVYVYLASKPPEWKINAKELQSHFGVGIKKIYKSLSDLTIMGLIERKEIREKGRFVDYEYYLYLSPKGQNGKTDSPNGQKPLSGEPNGQNGLTYKEESSCIKRKEDKKLFFLENTTQEQKQEINYYLKNTQFVMPKDLRNLIINNHHVDRD
jgi:predicted transcriptional regulator